MTSFKIQIPRSAKKGSTIAIIVSPKTRAFTAALYKAKTRSLELITQETDVRPDGIIEMKLQKGRIFNRLQRGEYYIKSWVADEKTGQGNMITAPFTIE